MTKKEKIKAYDEAILRAKEELKKYDSQDFSSYQQILKIFPELKKSRDEEIRKSLIILLQHFCKGYRIPGLEFPVSYREMLDWLDRYNEENEMVGRNIFNLIEKSYKQGSYALHKWEDDEMLTWLKDL